MTIKYYEYFVSYVHSGGFGRANVAIDRKINTIDDIAGLENMLTQVSKGIEKPAILFYQLLGKRKVKYEDRKE